MAKFFNKKRHNNFKKSSKKIEIAPETKRGIAVVLLFVGGVVFLLSLLNLAEGLGGIFINDALKLFFGWGSFLVPFILLGLAGVILFPDKFRAKAVNYAGLALFVLSFLAFLHLLADAHEPIQSVEDRRGGGYIGLIFYVPLVKFIGRPAGLVLDAGIMVIALLLTFNTSLHALGSKLRWLVIIPKAVFSPLIRLMKKRADRSKEVVVNYSQEAVEVEEEEKMPEFKASKIRTKQEEEQAEEEPIQQLLISDEKEKEEVEDKKRMRSRMEKIEIPLDLLNGKSSSPTSGDIKGNIDIIKKTLANFNIEVEMGEVNVGPTVTQFTLRPAVGVKLSQITTLANDLALSLAAHPIRIEAPIPGRSLVGVEVPNQSVGLVNLKDILKSVEFEQRKSNLSLGIGRDVAGKPFLAQLEKMPHMLIAGSTGSGKTVCINALVLSLLYQNNPNDLRFIMIDPKRVELTLYDGIPHLMAPVITTVPKTVNALKWAINEMERRYELLSLAHKRNISEYNQSRSGEEKIPYLVIIIDELADLMAASANEVEGAIIRLAQMARAVGIHLIVATQRPSVDVITGLIKANIGTRVAFSVASLVDSRTILDMSGAEKLLGRGDMLFISPEISKPKRLQGAFINEDEIKRVVDYLRDQAEPDYQEEITEKQSLSSGVDMGIDDSKDDPLIAEAKQVIQETGRASTTFIQRRFKLGYARAARILDSLEKQGVIGPVNGAKPREILISDEKSGTIVEENQVPATDRKRLESGDYDEEKEENPQKKGDYPFN